MARQYLAEGLKGAFPFIADAKKIVVESLPNGGHCTRIPGRFSICDCVNGNNRRYGKAVWEKNLTSGSMLMQSIGRNAAFGLLEHPKDGQVTLLSPISHLVIEAKLQAGRDVSGKEIWEVVGEIQVVGTEEGKKLTALIEAGYNPLVSSRGFGSLVRSNDGVDDVQDDYVCEGWDVVIKPSFDTAELSPQRETAVPEAAQAASTVSKPITEAVPAPVPAAAPAPQSNLKVEQVTQPSAPGSPVQVPGQKQPEPSPNKTMNLNEIKQALVTYKNTDATRLPPSQFAEGMSQLSALHQEVANFVAEDSKRSWQGQQLHNEIAALEHTWSETQLAPGKRADKLNENNTKLMQVIKAVAQTGLTYKNKLGESAKQVNRQTGLLNEVVHRGQEWRQLAKAHESASAKYRRRFMMATETLQALADKYKADVVELGRRVIQLEFKDKAEKPEIQKLLKEATKPKQIVEIRNILEGKKAAPAAAPVVENKTPEAKPEVKPKVKPATEPVKAQEGLRIVSAAPGNPRDLNEAVSMVTRLSQAATV